jgi:hypothetical protein
MIGNSFESKVSPDTAVDLNLTELNKNDNEERCEPTLKTSQHYNKKSKIGINSITVIKNIETRQFFLFISIFFNLYFFLRTVQKSNVL